MHAYLITGGDLPARSEEIARRTTMLKIHAFDTTSPEITGPTIGIEQIRAFIKTIALRPTHGTMSAGIIPQAELLTVEAQQALLKTLEEPPAHATLILSAPGDATLLPTVVSRCIKIAVTATTTTIVGDGSEKLTDFLTHLATKPIGERMAFVETVGKSKDEILAWIDGALRFFAVAIRDNTSPARTTEKRLFDVRLIHRLMRAKQQIQGNIHPLLALEHALICDEENKTNNELDKQNMIGYNDF
jgi:hypothetical protein